MATDRSFFSHETAVVESRAVIGAGTKIWHHAHVRDGARIGADCVLGKNVFVDSDASMGDRCKVQNNVSVYSGVHLGDDVFVGPSATFTNDLVPRAFSSSWQITETNVGNGASVGANATVVCGNSLGDYSMVAAGATVTHDVESHQLVAGTPARHMAWVCRCGTVVTRSAERPTSLVCTTCASEEAR